MLNLRPQRSFTVVRQIENHLDTDTNYVQAVIRNAYTDDIIATLQLTDRGGQRFSKNWQVPADPSGQGFFISIVTSVYTDSGYTTKNSNYGDQENTYSVKDDTLQRGGGSLDSATIRRIIQEELAKVEQPQMPQCDCPKLSEMPFGDILAALRDLPSRIEMPQQEKVEFAPVLAAIEAVKQAVDDKEVTPETEMQPVLDRIDAAEANLHSLILEGNQAADELGATLKQDIEAIIPAMEETIKSTELQIAPTQATGSVKPKQPAAPKPQEPQIDLQALAQ